MVVAMIALVVAIGGTAIAATKIGTKQLKNNAVTAKKIKKNAVTASKIKAKAVATGKLAASSVATGKIAASAVTGSKIAASAVTGSKIADGTVTGSKIADGTVTGGKIADGAVTGTKIATNAVDGSKVADDSIDSAKTSDYKVFGVLQVTATVGATLAAARDAAPEQPLLNKGPLEFYAKCYRDSVLDELVGAIFVRTTTDFSIMEGSTDLPGGLLATDYLNIATLEANRVLYFTGITNAGASYSESESLAAATDGTAVNVLTGIGVKNGAVAADGPYGPGNACIFQGSAMG